MNKSPKTLIEKLYQSIEKIFKNTGFSREKIALTVKNLSDIFNRFDGKIDYMKSDALKIAYIVYFYPINVYKCLHIINFYRNFFANKKIYFDYGAGPLTFFTACSLQQLEGERFFAYDKNMEILELGKSVIKDFSTKIYDVLKFSMPKVKVNVVFLGNILSELNMDDAQRLFIQLIKDIDTENNLIILIEPGTKKGFNNIQQVKKLLNKYGFYFLNACPTDNCPMDTKDWCHENLIFPRSQLIEYIEQKTGLNNRFINFTYALFSTKNQQIFDFNNYTFKVVSNLLDRKGEYAIYLCSKIGLKQFSILKKHIKESNREFINLRRGDIVYINDFHRISNFYRLTENSEVKVIKKFDCSNFS